MCKTFVFLLFISHEKQQGFFCKIYSKNLKNLKGRRVYSSVENFKQQIKITFRLFIFKFCFSFITVRFLLTF